MDVSLDTIHAQLLELLRDTVRVLDQNDLPYSMICGSLLGTVRHSGFIPWDDDVDLILPRESYERFEKLYPQQCTDGFCLDLSDTWVPRVRKASGQAFIDLFILDPLPQSPIVRGWKLFRLQALQGMLKERTDYRRFSLPKRILLLGTHVLGAPFGKEYKLRRYRHIARIGELDSPYLHMSNGAFSLLSMPFSCDVFDHLIPAPFEDLTVRVPRDSAAILTQLYGADYMTPPPQEKRQPVHFDR